MFDDVDLASRGPGDPKAAGVAPRPTPRLRTVARLAVLPQETVSWQQKECYGALEAPKSGRTGWNRMFWGVGCTLE